MSNGIIKAGVVEGAAGAGTAEGTANLFVSTDAVKIVSTFESQGLLPGLSAYKDVFVDVLDASLGGIGMALYEARMAQQQYVAFEEKKEQIKLLWRKLRGGKSAMVFHTKLNGESQWTEFFEALANVFCRNKKSLGEIAISGPGDEMSRLSMALASGASSTTSASSPVFDLDAWVCAAPRRVGSDRVGNDGRSDTDSKSTKLGVLEQLLILFKLGYGRVIRDVDYDRCLVVSQVREVVDKLKEISSEFASNFKSDSIPFPTVCDDFTNPAESKSDAKIKRENSERSNYFTTILNPYFIFKDDYADKPGKGPLVRSPWEKKHLVFEITDALKLLKDTGIVSDSSEQDSANFFHDLLAENSVFLGTLYSLTGYNPSEKRHLKELFQIGLRLTATAGILGPLLPFVGATEMSQSHLSWR